MRTSVVRAAAARRKGLLDPYTIKVPPVLEKDFDRVVELVSARTGESPDAVRRGVEVSVLARGIAAIRGEEGKR